MKAINKAIKKYPRMYGRARHAMTCSGENQSLLKQYKTLSIKDLQLNKDITEANQYYQRNDTLPRFWIVEIENQGTTKDWSTEGEFANGI